MQSSQPASGQLLQPSSKVKRSLQSQYNSFTAGIKGTLGLKSKDTSLSNGNATRKSKPKLLSRIAVAVPNRNAPQESETPSEQLHAVPAGPQETEVKDQSTPATSGTNGSTIANKGNQEGIGEPYRHSSNDVKLSDAVPKVAGSDKPFKFTNNPRNFTYGSNYVTNVIATDVNGTERLKRATLDSGAEVSMVASDVVQDLGIKIRKSSAGEVAIRLMFPNEEPIEPLGQSEVEWFFQEERKTYRSVFWVLDTERFDILIGGPLIKKHRLFKRKVRIWSW
ncbi:MAG: hypothetical protein M1813_008313 [Trichoglossum hirsutum]|nr:MAG: hypothetical protein M1813_008313 [Trichoglossum hirsutum]